MAAADFVAAAHLDAADAGDEQRYAVEQLKCAVAVSALAVDQCDNKNFMKKPRPGRSGKNRDAGDVNGAAVGHRNGEPESKRRRNSSRGGNQSVYSNFIYFLTI